MFLKDKIFISAVLFIFSATFAFAGGPDITTTPKKAVQTKAQKSAKKAVKKKTVEAARVNKTKQKKRKTKEITEVRQHSFGDAVYEPRLVAKNEEPLRKVNILFESNPTNAELMINGLYVGSTPVQIPLQRGVHNVKIFSSGHDEWERQVKAYKGLRVYAILEEKTN